MIERPPANTKPSVRIINLLNDPVCAEVFRKIEDEYLYFDKVKYLVPKGVDINEFWAAVRFERNRSITCIFGKYSFIVPVTPYVQRYLHEFDMQFGGTLLAGHTLSEKNRQHYLLSSLMEEAIASSKMEGAATTREAAKEMLRKKTRPKNKDQQMIVNNYNTIQFLSGMKNADLTPELLLDIHARISEKTLDEPSAEGRFRVNDDILVMDMISGDVIHNPPSFKEIDSIINDLCTFANNDDFYIHPVIKAIVIHFMVAFVHPFVDGNGRTARALFYWYMLKKGYWLTEYLSISRIISRSKGQYEKAFLYTEYDNNDLGYFIQYNIRVMELSYSQLKSYLKRKQKEEEAGFAFCSSDRDLNARQAQILQMFVEKPNQIYTSKELESIFAVSVKTIRSDLNFLVEKGYLEKINLNNRLIGYRRSKEFVKKIEEIRGKFPLISLFCLLEIVFL